MLTHLRKTEVSGSAGFTLVELMVVVAMIGVLAMIAIPSYDKFVARTHSTEAKIALSNIYMAESSFSAEYGSFSACLDDIGFVPEGSNRFFAIGFDPGIAALSACGPNMDQPCNKTQWQMGGVPCTSNAAMSLGITTAYPATASMPEGKPATIPTGADLSPYGSFISANFFSIVAISNSPDILAYSIADDAVELASSAMTLENQAHATSATCFHGFMLISDRRLVPLAPSSGNCVVPIPSSTP